MTAKLTRTEQVLAVLDRGGSIGKRSDGLLTLRDHNKQEVPAWLNAIKSAQKVVDAQRKAQRKPPAAQAKAMRLIRLALKDAERGDRVDCLDSLRMAADVIRRSMPWHVDRTIAADLAVAIADAACRSDVEIYAHVEEVDGHPVYDPERPQQMPGKADPDDDARAVAAARRAVAYIEARGDVFPWRMVRDGGRVRFVAKGATP